MDTVSAFKLEVRADKIAVITIDAPGEKMNTLKAEFGSQVRGLIRQLRDDKSVRGVVFISAKADNFIAGADINMIARCRSAQEAEALARQGQQIMAEIHGLSIPVIAAIHGACLGGGLELALACHGRICSDDEKTRLGLPEVQLGLLPGSGGTQRLPRLIGVSTALDMMLTGKQLRPRQALKAGLVDEVVPQAILLQAAVELALKGRPTSREVPVRERVLAGPLGRHLLFQFVGKQTQRKTQGNYPAVKRILQVVENGLAHGCSSGYAEEARAFGELAMSPQSRLSAQQVAERCVMMMLNEAARCFDEQIIRSARDGDIGAVFGIGFPPFLGGPFRYMDTIGAGEVAAILQRLAAQFGPRFTPCDTLLRMAEQGTTFWPADERLT